MWATRKMLEKNLVFRSEKGETGPSNIKESIITLEANTQIEAKVDAEAKIDLYIACITRKIQITGQEIAPCSLNPRRK
jgi:hypothetical protein